jgi:hypothetical protein
VTREDKLTVAFIAVVLGVVGLATWWIVDLLTTPFVS